MKAAGKEIAPVLRFDNGQPFLDGFPSLFGQFELDRARGLFLDNSCAVADPTVCINVVDFQADEIAAAQFAVDRHVEHRDVALSSLYLETNSDIPHVLRFEGTFLTGEPALVPGLMRVMLGLNGRRRHVSSSAATLSLRSFRRHGDLCHIASSCADSSDDEDWTFNDPEQPLIVFPEPSDVNAKADVHSSLANVCIPLQPYDEYRR
jgi:hypothetical protein